MLDWQQNWYQIMLNEFLDWLTELIFPPQWATPDSVGMAQQWLGFESGGRRISGKTYRAPGKAATAKSGVMGANGKPQTEALGKKAASDAARASAGGGDRASIKDEKMDAFGRTFEMQKGGHPDNKGTPAEGLPGSINGFDPGVRAELRQQIGAFRRPDNPLYQWSDLDKFPALNTKGKKGPDYRESPDAKMGRQWSQFLTTGKYPDGTMGRNGQRNSDVYQYSPKEVRTMRQNAAKHLEKETGQKPSALQVSNFIMRYSRSGFSAEGQYARDLSSRIYGGQHHQAPYSSRASAQSHFQQRGVAAQRVASRRENVLGQREYDRKQAQRKASPRVRGQQKTTESSAAIDDLFATAGM